MIDPIINKEVDELKKHLDRDPVSFYKNLKEFSKEYDASLKVQEDIVILGSQINEFAQNIAYSDEQKENKLEIVERATDILETIAKEAKTEVREKPIVNEGIDSIKEYFIQQKPENRSIFTCDNLSKRISDTFSLNNISLDLKLGEITGLVGENGNGKTSLLRIIAGELMHSSGTKSYPSFSQDKLDWLAIKGSIGYMKQTLLPWRGINSVRQQLQFTAAIKGITGKENERMFENITARLGLQNHKDKLWSELSGGYRVRFELARQLIWRPRLLILDEPLANLDVKTQLLFLNDLRNLTNSISHSMAVIISSQNIYEIEKIADQIIFIKDGKAFYNGKVEDVGMNGESRCYEIDTQVEVLELHKALKGVRVKEIRSDTFYKMIFTDRDTYSDDILKALSDQKIEIRYFRDITHSTRLLFEK